MSTSYFIKFRFEYSCTKSIRIGIIGLDTSHSVAFTDLINGDKNNALPKALESLRPIRMVQKLLNPALNVFQVISRK